MEPTPDPQHPVLVHFYRALVGHMDVWRQRMDATTNWAAAMGVLALLLVALAIRAPSEQMIDWAEVPSPLRRWIR